MPRHTAVRDVRGRQGVWVIALALTACSLLSVLPSAQERAVQGVRLNGIIERAEKGELIFAGEPWRMLPDLEVPGLGAVLLGLSDLSLSLGVGTPNASTGHPAVMAAVDRVAEACAAHHKQGGKVICGRYQTPEGLEAAIKKGFTMFTSGRAGA